MNRTQYQQQRSINSIRENPFSVDRSPYARAVAQSAGLDIEQMKADKTAQNDGFKNAADRELNRTMRDIFEIKLDQMGITDYNAAYSQLSGGRSLTSNMTIRDMINNVGTLGQKQNKEVSKEGDAGTESGTNNTIDDYENSNKGYEDLLAGISDLVKDDPMQAVGGPGSSLDGGATGFRRKRSSGRMAGLTNKGTSQLKITGQNTKSSGLNIG